MRWAEHLARMGVKSVTYWVLMGETEEMRPLARHSREWNNIKMYLQEAGFWIMD